VSCDVDPSAGTIEAGSERLRLLSPVEGAYTRIALSGVYARAPSPSCRTHTLNSGVTSRLNFRPPCPAK